MSASRLRAARGRHPPRRRALRRRRRRATGEVVFNTAMTGYQESVTDPSYAGPDHHLHLSADRQLRRQRRGDGVRRRPRPRGDHARRQERRGRAAAEGGWLDWLTRLRGAGDHRGRHARARASHPRRRRDARRHLRGRDPVEAEARERIAAEPPMVGSGPRARGHPRTSRSTSTATAPRRRGSTPGSSPRSSASSAIAAAG